ncbi:glycosyltransferase [Endozoicomonas sp. G2_1]|uniref:glycosyltransferase n=1 Tax=Endozoicomonas sp. G2_1 TaxID=2821091 RepID=UPI001ADD308F|nr:glycosyltransferase [Endozoicomonas sp. G2_1]MBO9489222.1 glycosyltransferase [Endozoicomonas sp. G2_1]
MMQTKRVAIFIDTLAGGGAEKVMMSLADTLVSLGHQPELIVLTSRFDYELPTNYPVHVLYTDNKAKINGFFDTDKHAQKLTQFIDKLETSGKYDLFLSNLDDCNRIVAACNFSPCYFVIHNSIEETVKRTKLMGPIKYAFLRQCLQSLNGKQLITVSDGIKQELETVKRIKPSSIQTIYNPFNVNKIRELAEQPDADIPQDDYIIHVGRFAKQKRHDILFKALRNVDSRYKLVCLCNKVGKAKKLAAKYGIEDRVILPGFKQNPYNWIANAKALVLSSDFEGLPTVLIEALTCNTIPVSTICPHGPDEILTGELSHYLAPRRNPEALAEKLNDALRSSHQSSTALSNADIFAKVDAIKVAERYLALTN